MSKQFLECERLLLPAVFCLVLLAAGGCSADDPLKMSPRDRDVEHDAGEHDVGEHDAGEHDGATHDAVEHDTWAKDATLDGALDVEADGQIVPPHCDEVGCPTLDFVTHDASAITATQATLHGELIALPGGSLSDHGFCWSFAAQPTDDQLTCESLGAPRAPGGFELHATTLEPGAIYHVRAYFSAGADTYYGNSVSFMTAAPAPRAFLASRGEHGDFVRLSWNPAEGASWYGVVRDGQELVRIPAADRVSYDDTGAGAAPAPGAPTLSASQGSFVDHVALSWSFDADAADGEHHEYALIATYRNTDSPASVATTGYRGSEQVSGFEVEIEGFWQAVNGQLFFNDTSAPAGTIVPGAISASKGAHDTHVALSSAPATLYGGVSVSYRVRALYRGASGAASALVSGYRGVGEATYHWQRSAGDSDANYSDLGGATMLNFADTSAPANGDARYYRVVVSAPGARAIESAVSRGYIRVFGSGVFTNCGQNGRSGPAQNQCDAAYQGSEIAGLVAVTNGFQYWTVPVTGTYRIEVVGARGGQSGQPGGLGAYMRGDFQLVAGQQLKILVGQVGLNGDVYSSEFYSAGGGGGSFVTDVNNSPLIIAGGGGGGGFSTNDHPNRHAT
ncbi:MAG: hypothetical protein H0U74_16375, partial [Bradymonadaceae bacterium]|nr:hypothetical protein [Lujinxingiaceae bacterium]